LFASTQASSSSVAPNSAHGADEHGVEDRRRMMVIAPVRAGGDLGRRALEPDRIGAAARRRASVDREVVDPGGEDEAGGLCSSLRRPEVR